MMELSKRLQAVADLVTPQMSVADIGTDHGYLPIWLLNSGKCDRAIAMDVKKGPLQHAEENRGKLLERGELALRQSDGLKALDPGEVQCAVLAGMGGGLILRILSEGQACGVTGSLKECILQPQSEIEKVRRFLEQEGYETIAEDMVEENGKYYPMMKVVPPSKKAEKNDQGGKAAGETGASDAKWSEAELRYGKMLLEHRHPVLKRFLLKEQKIRKKILTELQERSGERASQNQRIREIEEELQMIGQVLETYEPAQEKERRNQNAL